MANRDDGIQLQDGMSKYIDGDLYYYSETVGDWVHEDLWNKERITQEMDLEFTVEDFARCAFNIYSFDCLPAMMNSFGAGKQGLKLLREWNDEGFWVNFWPLLILWPFLLLAW